MPGGDEREASVTPEGQPEATRPVAAPVTPAAAPDLSDDVIELLEQGALASSERARRAREENVPAPAAHADDGLDDDEGDDEAEDGADEAADEGQEVPPSRGEVTAQFNQLVAAGQLGAALLLDPNRWSNIPSGDRTKAFTQAIQLVASKVATDLATLTVQQRRQETELRKFVDEKQRLRDDDPDAFADWEDEHPDDAARFLQARRYFRSLGTSNPQSPPEVPPQQLTPATQDGENPIQALANTQLRRLERLSPEARGAVVARVQAGAFPLTAAGLTALTAEIDDAVQAGAQKGQAPDSDRTRARQQAATKRRSAPKPIVPGGTGSANPNPIADITDPAELFAMAASSSGSRRSRPE